MYKYHEIIDSLKYEKNWIDEKEFIVHQLFEVSFVILSKCYKRMNNPDKTFIFPYLRKLKENSIYILGFEEKVLDANEFISNKVNQGDIFKRIEEKPIYINDSRTKLINNYFKILQKPLNTFTHSNFQTLMMFYSERLNDHLIDQYYVCFIELFLYLLETPLIKMYNVKYNKDAVNIEQ